MNKKRKVQNKHDLWFWTTTSQLYESYPKILRFVRSVRHNLCQTFSVFLCTLASMYEIIISWQILWFSDFVNFLYNFKMIRPHVRGHGSWERCSKFPSISWISLTLDSIRWISFFYYILLFKTLAVQIWLIPGNPFNKIKWLNIAKRSRNKPKFNMEYHVQCVHSRKSLEGIFPNNLPCTRQSRKAHGNILFCRGHVWAHGKLAILPCAIHVSCFFKSCTWQIVYFAVCQMCVVCL